MATYACDWCRPRPPSPPTADRGVDRTRTMSLLLKWSPTREVDTLDKHRAAAAAHGSTWWGCDSDSEARRTATVRLAQVNSQLADGRPTSAFLYRTGDAPSEAQVWRAVVKAIADDVADIDLTHRPPGADPSAAFLFVELTDFKPVATGWVESHLEKWDPPGGGLDAGALGNQTSPMFVIER